MMKRFLELLLTCLLLCGCAANTAPEESTALSAETIATESQATVPVGLYDPDSALEAATGGAVRAYPLDLPECTGLAAMGADLVVFSRTDHGTTLMKLTGEQLYVDATAQLDVFLEPESGSVHVSERGISYFDESHQQIVVLDTSLREISRFAAPTDLLGFPLLSASRETLYYCTPSAICALDLEKGINRVLKQIDSPEKSITGLWLGDTVLQCTVSDGDAEEYTLFLSTQTGVILHNRAGTLELTSSADTYYTCIPVGGTQMLLFGHPEEEPTALVPQYLNAFCCFLSQEHAAVTIAKESNPSRIILDYYDLESGLRTSSLAMESEGFLRKIVSGGEGLVYFLIQNENSGCTICLWNTSLLPTGDKTDYTGTYYTVEKPDYEGLARCQAYAEEIGSRYGIQVLIWEDATLVQPWDYDMETEYLVPVIWQELEQLDIRLGNYPEGFLETLAWNFTSLNICLVRQLTGTAESGSLDTAVGIQFWQDYDGYIALAAGQDTEHALYHELCHMIDTQVLSRSNAYDSWERLNPEGFSYDLSYIANQERDGSEYLQEDTRAFIDTYSMSFPKEDRARIMEYAMTEGNEAYFCSPIMQAKLKQLCLGIRKAFGLTKSTDTFLWEQYLQESLAYPNP